jgi:hypothetical protein
VTGPVRLAGWGRSDGSLITWTISEGRRGRRWREVRSRDGQVVHALLLETDPETRFAHLELAADGVQLTLHPDRDGTLHGNRVDAAGVAVEHVEGLPFGREAMVLVAGSPIALAAVGWSLRDLVDPGAAIGRRAAVIDDAGRVAVGDHHRIERRGPDTWAWVESPVGLSAPGGPADALTVDIDQRGIPRFEEGAIWPLER